MNLVELLNSKKAFSKIETIKLLSFFEGTEFTHQDIIKIVNPTSEKMYRLNNDSFLLVSNDSGSSIKFNNAGEFQLLYNQRYLEEQRLIDGQHYLKRYDIKDDFLTKKEFILDTFINSIGIQGIEYNNKYIETLSYKLKNNNNDSLLPVLIYLNNYIVNKFPFVEWYLFYDAGLDLYEPCVLVNGMVYKSNDALFDFVYGSSKESDFRSVVNFLDNDLKKITGN